MHTHTHTHLYESVKGLKDLFLDEDREDGGVGQQLADELLNPWQKDLHCCQQWLPLIRLPVPGTCRYASMHTINNRMDLFCTFFFFTLSVHFISCL